MINSGEVSAAPGARHPSTGNGARWRAVAVLGTPSQHQHPEL